MNRPSRSLVSRPDGAGAPGEQPARERVGAEGEPVGGVEHRADGSPAATWSRPLSAFDAVAMDTPASRATSVSVAGARSVVRIGACHPTSFVTEL